MSVAGKRVALVGGAGFIGHHLALELARLGAHVDVVDSLEVNNLLTFTVAPAQMRHRQSYVHMLTTRLELLREAGVKVHLQDARNAHGLATVLSGLAPQIIVHLAAVSHANRSNADPHSTFDHSLMTLENALDWARGQVEQFIFISSSMAYGNFLTPAVSEDHPLSPIGIYGAFKVAGEKMVAAHGQVFDLPYTIVRPSALYGPRCVSRRVIQIFIEAARDGEPLIVDADPHERFDFTCVDDLVGGMTRAMDNPLALGQIFNLSFGHSRSMTELIDLICEKFPGVRVKYVERDRSRAIRGTLAIDKAKQVLGYEPRFPLEIGLTKYVDWYATLPSDQPVAV